MAISDKELGNAFQAIAEQLNAISGQLSQLGAGLTAVKMVLAVHMNPSSPTQASDHIQTIEGNLQKLDPNAAGRKKLSEAIEILKMIDKHGGLKDA